MGLSRTHRLGGVSVLTIDHIDPVFHPAPSSQLAHRHHERQRIFAILVDFLSNRIVGDNLPKVVDDTFHSLRFAPAQPSKAKQTRLSMSRKPFPQRHAQYAS